MKLEITAVLNKTYGGFDLSEKAVRLYLERKGLPCSCVNYFGDHKTYFKSAYVPDILKKELSSTDHDFDEWCNKFRELVFKVDDIPRTDPDLIYVVETLGAEANTRYSKLEVDTVYIEIDSYDGIETLNVRL